MIAFFGADQCAKERAFHFDSVMKVSLEADFKDDNRTKHKFAKNEKNTKTYRVTCSQF